MGLRARKPLKRAALGCRWEVEQKGRALLHRDMGQEPGMGSDRKLRPECRGMRLWARFRRVDQRFYKKDAAESHETGLGWRDAAFTGGSMKSRDFVYWLQGYLEISEEAALTKEQVKLIRKHLALVFKH